MIVRDANELHEKVASKKQEGDLLYCSYVSYVGLFVN